jgi:hypothetical protein
MFKPKTAISGRFSQVAGSGQCAPLGIRYHPLVGTTPRRGLRDLRVISYPYGYIVAYRVQSPLLGMSQNPESVPFVRWVLQTLAHASHLPWMQVPGIAGVSQTDERWFLLPQEDALRCPARYGPTRG